MPRSAFPQSVWSDGQGCVCHKFDKKVRHKRAVTLLELLVAISIIALSMGIMMPVLSKGRRNAKSILTMNNQRQIIFAVMSYASNNNGEYPPSVATIGDLEGHCGWQEPMMLSALSNPGVQHHRSMGYYLGSYIQDSGIMFCPNAPRRYKYLQHSWEQGDEWDNPETSQEQDSVIGVYCFYWNYTGYLVNRGRVFSGPLDSARTGRGSRLLVSDYFGYGHWRNKNVYGSSRAFGSCERFKGARITPGTYVSSDFWSLPGNNNEQSLNSLMITLNAGYTDGHVESYFPSEVIPMKVLANPEGTVPYPDDLGPGIIYLPENALF